MALAVLDAGKSWAGSANVEPVLRTNANDKAKQLNLGGG